MNIFALEGNADGSIDWKGSAESQDNYRVVKMALESCQMLSTVLNNQNGGAQVAPYRSTHAKHPSTLWAGESSANFLDLVTHARHLLREHSQRFPRSKEHKCWRVLDRIVDLFDADKFDCHERTPLKLAMPDEFRTPCVIESYRRFYASKPNIRYPRSKVPAWFDEYRGDLPYVVVEG